MKNKSPARKGFTIIELIVVIAIIAILAAIVLVNVMGYIKRAKDAAIKSDLVAVTKKALSFYVGDLAGSSSYTTFSASARDVQAIGEAGGDLDIGVSADGQSFCASSKLASNPAEFWCSDSSGFSGSGQCGTTTGLCGAGTGGGDDGGGGNGGGGSTCSEGQTLCNGNCCNDLTESCINGSCILQTVCGNSSCEAGETCSSCPSDCGQCPGVFCVATGVSCQSLGQSDCQSYGSWCWWDDTMNSCGTTTLPNCGSYGENNCPSPFCEWRE